MAIIYRTDGSGTWGTGKGSNLTPEEVDGNFFDLDERLRAIEETTPAPVGIDTIDVSGNQMLITLTDTRVLGPFAIPASTWRMMGEWQASTLYSVNDMVSNNGSIYFVRKQHTSALTFDPTLFDVDVGYVYALLLERPRQAYDLAIFYGDFIPSNGQIIAQHVFNRPVMLAAGFVGCQAYLKVAATTEVLDFIVYKNLELIGTITFTPGLDLSSSGDGGQFGVFTPASPVYTIEFIAGDRLLIQSPYPTEDATAEGLAVTLSCFA